jgi:hypothetical protein
MKNSRAQLLGLCFTAALSIAPVLAQVNYGTLTGTVEDQNGGAVPEAIVRVTNTATAQSRQAPQEAPERILSRTCLPALTTCRSRRLDFAHSCEPASP